MPRHSTSEPVLQLQQIRKRFGRVEALAGIDLELRAGEIRAILGENGAGKSTLMHVIYGMVAPDNGRVTGGRRRRIAARHRRMADGVGKDPSARPVHMGHMAHHSRAVMEVSPPMPSVRSMGLVRLAPQPRLLAAMTIPPPQSHAGSRRDTHREPPIGHILCVFPGATGL